MSTFNYINSFSVRLTAYVTTEHKQNLDLVLDNAQNRTGTDYQKALEDCVIQEIKKLPFICSFVGWGAYGDVYFTVETSLDSVDKTLDAMNRAVKTWVNRYNVNKMNK